LILSWLIPAFAAKQYSYFRVGNPNDVTTSTTGGTVLMGGGTDEDAAFQWRCGRSGNGDFLVIRATGTDAYNPYIQQLCPNENSVATLIIPNRTAASDPFVISTIQNAEALWIAGGDQSNYINFWKGTPVEHNLNALIARNVPIGGTSAGMNVLTEFVYSALASQGVTSSQALADPRAVTLGRKNYLFAGSDAGHLRDVLTRIADRPIRRIEELLPWNLAPNRSCAIEPTA
jgi:cyanophycinase